MEQRLENLEVEFGECKGILKGKKRKELQSQIDGIKSHIEPMKQRLADIVKEYGYPSVKTFLLEYQNARIEYADFKQAFASWDRRYEKKEEPKSIKARLKQYEKEVKQQENNRIQVQKKDRGTR